MNVSIYIYTYVYASVFTSRGVFFRVLHFWPFLGVFVVLGGLQRQREKERERE